MIVYLNYSLLFSYPALQDLKPWSMNSPPIRPNLGRRPSIQHTKPAYVSREIQFSNKISRLNQIQKIWLKPALDC